MAEAPGAAPLPNPWLDHAGKSQRAQGRGDGMKGKAGGKGKGKWRRDADGGGNGNKSGSIVPLERRALLAAEVRAFAAGLPSPSASPEVGDDVEVVHVFGTDRQRLQGRLGQVLGVVDMESIGNEKVCTVRLELLVGDTSTEPPTTSIPASQLRVVGGRPPRTQLSFPSSLNGYERKFIHGITETLGLQSQSFGQGPDRRLVLMRMAPVAVHDVPPNTEPSHVVADRHDERIHVCSGVVLSDSSRVALLEAVTHLVPEDWVPLETMRFEMCQGPLSNPKVASDHRDIAKDLRSRIQDLVPGSAVELFVASVGMSNDALAIGVIGAPSLARTPHVTVALAPGAVCAASVDIKSWDPWMDGDLALSGSIAQWPAEHRISNKSTTARAKASSVSSINHKLDVVTPDFVPYSGSADATTSGDASRSTATQSQEIPFEVRIKTLGGDIFDIAVCSSELVKQMKEKIVRERSELGSPATLRVIFAGQILEDGSSIASYAIRGGATVVVIGSKPSSAPS